MLLCYITDRTQFPGDENRRRRALLAKIAEAARCGVDLIQLREKDLPARELERLAFAALHKIHALRTENQKTATRLLINSRTDVAIACGADGAHLRSDDISPSQVRKIWAQATQLSHATISVSCHSSPEVAQASSQGGDFAIFAPVFEKNHAPQVSLAGLDGLREVCRHKIPVFALGGITLKNAHACHEAGATGIAAIRLFQENDIAAVVRQLKG